LRDLVITLGEGCGGLGLQESKRGLVVSKELGFNTLLTVFMKVCL
jgi:hypothetical protein